MPVLKVVKTHPKAVLPAKASSGAAAFDLAAALDAPVVIEPGKTVVVSTGIAVELPFEDAVALVFSRSGLSVSSGISLINSVGVIDSDYRGTIRLGLINHSDTPFQVECGDRLAQLMVVGIISPSVVEVEELGTTERGEGGFGSTGIR